MALFDLFRRKPPPADPTSSALRLSLEVHTLDNGSATHTSATFTLAGSFDLRDTGGERGICDYGSRRLLSLRSDGTYTDRSLSASVLFRAMEFSNREYLLRALNAGGVDPSHHMKTGLSRHNLAQGPGTQAELRWSGLAAEVDGERAYARSREAWPEPPWAVARFSRLIRREYGGHPEIFQRLAEQGEIPRSLTLRFRDPVGQVTEHEIRVVDCAIVPAEPAPSIAGLRWRLDADEGDALWAGLAAARAGGPANEADLLRTKEQLRPHLDAERWVPVALGIFEATWLHAAVPEGMLHALSGLQQSDPDVGRLVATIQPREADAVQGQVAELETFRALAADKAHVIDILRASLLRQIGQNGDAEAGYRAALAVNQRLAGPYHDLGFVYMQRYACEDAFRCWDVARWLSPDHPIHSDVAELEADIWSNEAAVPYGRALIE